MTFVVLNLFISVILVAFSEEQLHHKVQTFTFLFFKTIQGAPFFKNVVSISQPSEEEEIVDLMLMKICSLLGIKVKKNQLPEEPKARPFAIS